MADEIAVDLKVKARVGSNAIDLQSAKQKFCDPVDRGFCVC
jgi:hypothetical protein